ncbi:poly(ADP-ribose) polymerase family member 14-related sequence 1 [Lampris incognitus]|uniref:poly(ADP-ribose) polymerase family member 14-related sequence 1 n=1 Tax=Lampris incognitus TaxID=2546036 RepID=UPI0024B60C41|nr:poly(ADP-ribose) polymerase family member 14-related sequence 1 [Lampris incognitus]
MDNAYRYALIVELDKNDIPKLKNKLVKYFQSRKSNGGDCQVEYENHSGTAAVRFRSDEVRRRVLEKKTHEVHLNQGLLKMTVRLPDEESSSTLNTPSENLKEKSHDAGNTRQAHGDGCAPDTGVEAEVKSKEDKTAEEELCSTSAVLENVSHSFNFEFLEMLVENILKVSDSSATLQDFSLEVLSEFCCAVATFQSAKVNTDFISRCPSNRIFKKNGFSVRPLEVTTQVRIEDIQNVSADHLFLYFENEGVDVEAVLPNEEDWSAVITFKNPQVIPRVIQEKHFIQQKYFKVFPFYESLGTALYGKDRPMLKLPAAFSETIDHSVWSYLHKKPDAAETIHTDLAKHFCKVDLQQSTVHLSPSPQLLHQKGVKAKDINEWKHTVKGAFDQALSRFKSINLEPQLKAWEDSEMKVREALVNEDVGVFPDKHKGILSVVGLVDNVSRLEQTLGKIINITAIKVQRENSSITDVFSLSPSIYHILCQADLQQKILLEYPELKLQYKVESGELLFHGLNHEVLGANKIVMHGVTTLKRRMLEFDDFVFEFVKGSDEEKLTHSLLTSNGIDAMLEITSKGMQLVAVSESALNKAEDHLKRLLVSQYLVVEDGDVLKMPEWRDLVSRLKDNTDDSHRKILISHFQPNKQVVVSGYRDSVKTVHSYLDDFLTQNAKVEETVAVKSTTIVKYIQEYNKNAWSDEAKDKVAVSFQKQEILLSGSRVSVTKCKTMFEHLVSLVVFDTLKVIKPGVKRFFQEKEALFVSIAMNETGSLIQLVDKNSGKEEEAPKPIYQLKTSDGVEIAVCNADMCSYPVYAVVNASNQDLKQSGGLAGALLDAAGPQLQVECDKIINQKGPLKPGGCVVTGAGGRLNCKMIIHAVGPRFDQANHQRAEGQLRRAVKRSLELAEEHGCLSVALPAISRNLGFPLPLCARTIVSAVKEHCDDKFGDNTLKRIHFVNNDDSAVNAMEAAVRQAFGKHGVSHSKQGHPSNFIHVRQTMSSNSNANQVLTKEGLSIVLTKGNIQDATTEVIVNAVVGEDLILNKGAVSKAILDAAGQELQALVKQNKSSGKFGDIIITNGCKLKSSQIFHAVICQWDSGRGTAQKILSGIMKDCLVQAEDNKLSSITFPAIGTGNLGFPKGLVVSLMLDEILNFSSSKQPKHLKKVVLILHPRDAPTIQVFTDEFNKRFSSSSHGPAPTSPSAGPFTKVISSSGMYETKMGSVAIQVVTGDITKETTDVIVNSTNESFNLKSGVSMAILNAAGQTVEAECLQLGAGPNPGMIMTQPGNLKSQKILHMVGQTDPQKINKLVKDALQMCVQNSYTSVSFPAIGTGQGNVQASQVADAMFDAVIDMVGQNLLKPLKTIRIVVFQPGMLKDFHGSMQMRETADNQDIQAKWSLLGNIGHKLKSFFTGDSTSKSQKTEDFVIEGKKVDPACFHICSDSQAKVDSAKQWISKLISKEESEVHIDDKSIPNLTSADQKRLINIQMSMDVRLRTERKNSNMSIIIDGLSADVLKATTEIHEMLKKARDEESLKEYAKLAAAVTDWQYQQQGLPFQSFDLISNFHLEQALEKAVPHVEVSVQGQVYKVIMPNGPATDNQGQTLQIKRIDLLKDQQAGSFPQQWDAIPAKSTCHVVPVQPGAAEYNEVLKMFQATCNSQTIIKIERIQNPSLWKGLQIKKQDMEQRNGHQNNEKRLFHGTCYTTINHINNHGFNRSYAGKNAAAYGNGTYFAVAASYSANDTYSKPDPQGQKFIYLCRVLTGDYTKGKNGMIVPPPKRSNDIQQYDSVVDNEANPSMFIIFHDSQAYPEYLLTFK